VDVEFAAEASAAGNARAVTDKEQLLGNFLVDDLEDADDVLATLFFITPAGS